MFLTAQRSFWREQLLVVTMVANRLKEIHTLPG